MEGEPKTAQSADPKERNLKETRTGCWREILTHETTDI